MGENSFMASPQPERPTASLLKQGLGNAQEACPAPDIIATYCEGALDKQESAHYELHFSQCARCREELAAMARASTRESVAASRPRGRDQSWIFAWPWLAPVAATILIVAIWIGRRPAPHGPQNATFAVSQPSQDQVAPQATPPLPDKSIRRLDSQSPVAESRQKFDLQSKVKPGLIAPQPPKDEKKELAINRPLAVTNESQLGGVARDRDQLKQNPGSVNGLAAGVPAPQTAPSPGAAAASMQSVVTEAEPSTVGGVSGQNQTEAANSVDAHSKVDGSPMEQRTLTQQAQTQRMVQAQAMSLEAFDKRAMANVIAPPNGKTLWRVDGSRIERSKDRGASWKMESPIANAQFVAGSAPDADTCWLVGRNGLVVLTTDAANWKTIPAPALADLVAITAQNASAATVTAADGRKFSTTDAGQHWTASSPQP
jgi:hypothetical protein